MCTHTHTMHTYLLKEKDASFTCSLEFCDDTNLIPSVHFYGVYLQPHDKCFLYIWASILEDTSAAPKCLEVCSKGQL